MISFKKYIENNFSDELIFLVSLSQDKLDENSLPKALDHIDWNEFIRLAKKHRLVSHLLIHSKYLADNFPIRTYEKLIEIRLDHSKLALNYTVHALRVHEKFEENKISHCFFKGPFLSLDLYKDIGFRNFGDIDILVEKHNIEKAKQIIEELDFKCIYPRIQLTKKQQKVNYSISHHYHFKHPKQNIHIELHWTISNPKSYFGKETKDIIAESSELAVSKYKLPYISKIDNLVYQAAHGAIHQWYRLFWLKDFSELFKKTSSKEIQMAFELSKKLNLDKCFLQAINLSHLIYNIELPKNINVEIRENLIKVPLSSIELTDLNQLGIKGKVKSLIYRLNLKPDLNYYFELIYRLRTHLIDWELLKLPSSLFFLYYILRPFILLYRFLFKKKS